MFHRSEYDDDRDIMELRDEPDEFELTDGLEIVDDGDVLITENDTIYILEPFEDE